jgi:GT2 family glycosyltransferase
LELSVLTPSYNYGVWLVDALDSVHYQGVPAREHIVLDDGSTDGSAEIARAHRSAPRVLEQENIGLAATLNRLLTLVSGKWIGWLNADDFYLPGAFAALRDAVGDDPSLDVLVGDTVFVDRAARVQRLLPAHRITGSVTKHHGMTAGTSAFFVRRSALEAIGGFREGTKFLMDKWLFWQLWEHGCRFGYVPVPLGAMRRHSDQQSQVQRDPGAEERAEFRRALDLPTTGLGRYVSKSWGRSQHLAYKLLDRGWASEWSYRRHRGVDARWWDANLVSTVDAVEAPVQVLRRTQANAANLPGVGRAAT